MSRRRIRDLALIAIAGGMLAFEAVVLWGALPVVRRVVQRTDHRHVRVVAVTREARFVRTAACPRVRLMQDLQGGTASLIRAALL
ncbi:MAG: hypothetical protein E6K81_08320 [Candidatus Eisenbacteria bacterium]|uniref:Uncharacterized protein n=1 Tax=Eiseniibacteriota bacterium TaxID=2212470 RepID=A0A538U8C9_UNCEI|nr:MAG: hypothetical protein E6K81_08320 [Candidatus Eisenbacteria bacterium]